MHQGLPGITPSIAASQPLLLITSHNSWYAALPAPNPQRALPRGGPQDKMSFCLVSRLCALLKTTHQATPVHLREVTRGALLPHICVCLPGASFFRTSSEFPPCVVLSPCPTTTDSEGTSGNVLRRLRKCISHKPLLAPYCATPGPTPTKQ